MQRSLLFLLLQCCLLCSFGQQRSAFAGYDEARLTQRADSVLKLMTLDEKLGQLIQYSSDLSVTGPVVKGDNVSAIKAGRVGSLLNAYGADFTRKIQQIAVNESRLKIPLLFGYDVIHGFRTIFPAPLGLAATWDSAGVTNATRIAALEASSAGLHWTFAPMCDIARDPRWGRIVEGSGEDPYLGSVMSRASVQGYQGSSYRNQDRILACVKHFAAYGAAEAGRDYNSTDMSERTLREIYLPPYKSAVDAGAATVMTSFNDLNGQPATGNHFLLTQVLRKEWGFKGFVVSDYTAVAEMIPHGYAADSTDAAIKALTAGMDMDMMSGIYTKFGPTAVKAGKIPMADVDEAVRRILKVKFMLGLFDNPYIYCNPASEKANILTAENRAAARDMGRKACVLLKNEGSTLPLSPGIKTLALIGPLVEARQDMIGPWSGAGEAEPVVNMLEGMKAALPNTQLLSVKGCDFTGDDRSGFDAAVKAAGQADAVVMFLGETGGMTGEASSRSDISLPGVQEELLKAVAATGKPVVLVLFSGRPLIMNWADGHIPAILQAWWPGTEAGNALADVLTGAYNPSGKLPVSWPRSVGQIPLYYNHKNTGRPRVESDHYTSKYIDLPNTPLYPFGYGLSYTHFAYSDLQLSQTSVKRSGALDVSIILKNTGNVKGTETVQLYTQTRYGSVTHPVQELKAFQQVSLGAGEVKTIVFHLPISRLASYDAQMHLGVEPGAFRVMVGGSSDQVLKADFTITQ